MSGNHGQNEYARAYWERVMRPKTEEELAEEKRQRRENELALYCGAAQFPEYPTRKGLHLLRRALPETPLSVGQQLAKRAGKAGL